MPQAVAVPEAGLRHAEVRRETGRAASRAEPSADGREAASTRPVAPVARTVEERLAVLEATSATSADLRELRSEVRLVRWGMGMVAAALVGLIGVVFTFHGSTNARIDQVNGRIDQLQSEVNTRFDQVNGRINQLQIEMNARIDSAVSELRAENREINQRLDRIIELLAQQAQQRAQ